MNDKEGIAFISNQEKIKALQLLTRAEEMEKFI